MTSLQILRRLDNAPPDLLAYLDAHGQLFEIEGQHAGFYIENDKPRDTEIVQDIVAHTRDFAVADDELEIHGHFSRLDVAERAMKGAVVTLAVAVDVDEDAEPEPPKVVAKK